MSKNGNNKRKGFKLWHKVVTCLLVVVLIFTTNASIFAAIAKENATYCSMDEHIHSVENGCYNVNNSQSEELTGGGNSQIENSSEQELVCLLPEHTHSESCFIDQKKQEEETQQETSHPAEDTTFQEPTKTQNKAPKRVSAGDPANQPSVIDEGGANDPTIDTSSPRVDKVEILSVDNNTNEVVVNKSTSTSFYVYAHLTGRVSNELWLGYRFKMKEKGIYTGTAAFTGGSYSWLLDLTKDNTKATVKKQDGYIILEGKIKATSQTGQVCPGQFITSISVNTTNFVNNDSVVLEAESWVIGENETPASGNATITTQVESVYKMNINWFTYLITGYYNKNTNEFKEKLPEDNQEDWTYGRVFRVRSFAVHQSGELRDPAKPLSFDITYELYKNSSSANNKITAPEQVPIVF